MTEARLLWFSGKHLASAGYKSRIDLLGVFSASKEKQDKKVKTSPFTMRQ